MIAPTYHDGTEAPNGRPEGCNHARTELTGRDEKDVKQLKRRLDELQELIARGQKQVLRDVKRAIAKAAAKKV